MIKPDSLASYIEILISPEDDLINSAMIVRIIQNNSSPIYLQKNQLNLGFIPNEIDYNYYYVEIFKREEGEIILFNKR